MFLLYDVLLFFAFIVALPWFLFAGLTRGKYLGSFRERLGRYNTSPTPHDVWMHAVSVGEVNAARLIADALEELQPNLRLVITTTTATGQASADKLFHEATVAFVPFDFSFAVGRFLDHHRPRVFASVETEIWPNAVRISSGRGVRLVLMNARLSDESFPRYRRFRFFLHRLLSRYSAILTRDEEDRRRFIAIGARDGIVSVGGNVKFDYAPDERPLAIEPQLRAWIGDRFLFVAGSTTRGEDEMLISAMPRILALNCRVIIAPRKPERFDEVAALLRQAKTEFARRSEMDRNGLRGDVLLLDSLGELARVYPLAVASFIGGSLVPAGGHNPIESAAVGTPAAYGPHMTNFREVASMFVAADAARQVNTIDQLVEFVGEMTRDRKRRDAMSRNGTATVERNRGAAKRNAQRVLDLLT